jgi:hypothetical protein
MIPIGYDIPGESEKPSFAIRIYVRLTADINAEGIAVISV